MNIRIVSPAGQVNAKVIDNGAATLRSWGHHVTIAPHAKDHYGRFAASPEDRANDIIEALEDKNVDLLWCSRGGYGTMQILDKIPVDLIAQANKPIVGFSDVTALHALWQKAGVRSLHAPMMKHLADDPTHRSTRTLRELVAYYESKHSWPEKHNMLFVKGWEGETLPAFVGGNLAVMTGLHGTPYDFDYSGKILVIEEIGEAPYKIDRMLQQLRLMGVFNQIRGMVCGHFTDCPEDPTMPLKLWDNVRHMGESHGLTVWMGQPIGHELENYPIVIG